MRNSFLVVSCLFGAFSFLGAFLIFGVISIPFLWEIGKGETIVGGDPVAIAAVIVMLMLFGPCLLMAFGVGFISMGIEDWKKGAKEEKK